MGTKYHIHLNLLYKFRFQFYISWHILAFIKVFMAGVQANADTDAYAIDDAIDCVLCLFSHRGIDPPLKNSLSSITDKQVNKSIILTLPHV